MIKEPEGLERGLAKYMENRRRSLRWGLKCDWCGRYSTWYNLDKDQDGNFVVLCYQCQYSCYGRERMLALIGKL